MRPHVEFIHEDDYIWHPADLPHGDGEAVQRNLSVDEEDGSASLRVDFRSAFTRPGGFHGADTEWYVLAGQVIVGEHILGPGGYFRVPKGIAMPAVRVAAGTRILLYRELGNWGFVVARRSRDGASGSITFLDTNLMEAEHDPSQVEGLLSKILHQDPRTGASTSVVWAPPGWHDPKLAHHVDVWEEMYVLSGRVTYNYGTLVPGTYFFRPPRVKHGYFLAPNTDGCTWILRTSGHVVRLYTADPDVTVTGQAENYDQKTEGPVIVGIPLRSRSSGEWDGTGR